MLIRRVEDILEEGRKGDRIGEGEVKGCVEIEGDIFHRRGVLQFDERRSRFLGLVVLRRSSG